MSGMTSHEAGLPRALSFHTLMTAAHHLQAPWKNRPEYRHADRLADELADLLAPQAGSYYDVWLDGEKYYSAEREVRVRPHRHHAAARNLHAVWPNAQSIAERHC